MCPRESRKACPLPQSGNCVCGWKSGRLTFAAPDVSLLAFTSFKIALRQSAGSSCFTRLTTISSTLAPTGWLASQLCSSNVCPFCEGENKKAKQQLAKLQAATVKITQSLSDVDRAPAVVSEELLELEKEQGIRKKELNGIHELLERLIASNEEAQAQKRTSDTRREAAGEVSCCPSRRRH